MNKLIRAVIIGVCILLMYTPMKAEAANAEITSEQVQGAIGQAIDKLKLGDNVFVVYEFETLHVVNMSDIYNKYTAEYDWPEWDTQHRLGTIYALWPFLTDTCGYSPEIAAGILGNICWEGKCGQYFGKSHIDDPEDIMEHLAAEKSSATGLVQWYSYKRRLGLLDRYEVWYPIMVAMEHPEYTSIVAELEFLHKELDDYGIFKEDVEYSVEDACGLIAVYYEGYKHASDQWEIGKNTAKLVSGKNTNSYLRLKYANEIYNLMTEGN